MHTLPDWERLERHDIALNSRQDSYSCTHSHCMGLMSAHKLTCVNNSPHPPHPRLVTFGKNWAVVGVNYCRLLAGGKKLCVYLAALSEIDTKRNWQTLGRSVTHTNWLSIFCHIDQMFKSSHFHLVSSVQLERRVWGGRKKSPQRKRFIIWILLFLLFGRSNGGGDSGGVDNGTSKGTQRGSFGKVVLAFFMVVSICILVIVFHKRERRWVV